MPLQTGQVLNNRYRIVKLLGQGGFGAVYRAWDMNLERPLALKENLDTTPEAESQFKHEAQLLFDLSHPSLPRVIDHFVIPNQGQYLVMEFIEGEDLQQLLDRTGGPLPESQVIPWIEQICDALGYLHRQKPPVIHRDIKPANIKITPEGKAVLVDFGIAKVYDPRLRTTVGARAVTAGYSPPEQYGQGRTDARTDVYALGATLYTLLTGITPPASVDVVAGGARPPGSMRLINPRISQPVDLAVVRSMNLVREQRFQNMREFKAALRAAPPVAPTQHVAQPVSPARTRVQPAVVQPVKTTTSGKIGIPRWLPWTAGAAILGLLVIILVLINQEPEEVVVTIPVAQEVEPSVTLPPTETRQPTFTPTITLTPTPQPPTFTPLPGIGSTQVSPFDSMVMVFIPEGPFDMGSGEGEEDEVPVHSVYVEAFWMDQTNVTNYMFSAFVDATGHQTAAEAYGKSWVFVNGEWIYLEGADWRHPLGSDSNLNGREQHPVLHVSWDDAVAYCAWAGRRLPTEAEWEKAARGGLEGKIYPWGNDDPVCTPGAFNGAQFNECGGDTVPVRSFSANGYGLFDMVGNVWDWVADWYGSDYYGVAPSYNPLGPESGESRVLRGSGSLYYLYEMRLANRSQYFPSYGSNNFGVRCAAGFNP